MTRIITIPIASLISSGLLLVGLANAAPVHHWSFDSGDIVGPQDSAGAHTALDTIGGANATLESTGAFTTTDFVFGDSSLNTWSGNQARIPEADEITLAVSDDAWSLAFWFKGWQQNGVLIGDSSVTQDALYLRDSTTNPRVQIRDIGFNVTFTGANIDQDEDEWNHVVVTRDNTGTFLGYLNGVLGDETTQTQGSNWTIDSLSGGRPGHNYNGLMDEIWIFDHALSADEVQLLMTTNSIVAAVPEPQSFAIALVAVAGLAVVCGRRRRRQIEQ